jgi:tryptophan 2,3-dioxygenase
VGLAVAPVHIPRRDGANRLDPAWLRTPLGACPYNGCRCWFTVLVNTARAARPRSHPTSATGLAYLALVADPALWARDAPAVPAAAPTGDARMSLSYAAYLHLDQLLALQTPRSDPEEHDELLFIVIHQVYELWFKLLLHELEQSKVNLSQGDVFGAVATFKRLRTVMKTLVGQLDILETMTPMSFTAFRDRLETSSGFQSAQFREIEFVLGYKRPDLIAYQPNVEGRAALERRLYERSVVDHFYDLLEHEGVHIPVALRDRDRSLPTMPDPAVQAGLLHLYRTRGDCTVLFEVMTDFDEGLQEWRYRHVKVVERTIGSKQGTGGSLGVEFLKQSLFKPVFPDLWAIRHEL